MRTAMISNNYFMFVQNSMDNSLQLLIYMLINWTTQIIFRRNSK